MHPEYGVIDHFIEALTGIKNSIVLEIKAKKMYDMSHHLWYTCTIIG